MFYLLAYALLYLLVYLIFWLYEFDWSTFYCASINSLFVMIYYTSLLVSLK